MTGGRDPEDTDDRPSRAGGHKNEKKRDPYENYVRVFLPAGKWLGIVMLVGGAVFLILLAVVLVVKYR